MKTINIATQEIKQTQTKEYKENRTMAYHSKIVQKSKKNKKL